MGARLSNDNDGLTGALPNLGACEAGLPVPHLGATSGHRPGPVALRLPSATHEKIWQLIEQNRQLMRKTDNRALVMPWRLPAALSTLALLALTAWPPLDRFASGTFARETMAFVLALGACSMLLGFGLGLWIAVRVRTVSSLAAGAWSVLVALAWWWVVFGPLLERADTG